MVKRAREAGFSSEVSAIMAAPTPVSTIGCRKIAPSGELVETWILAHFAGDRNGADAAREMGLFGDDEASPPPPRPRGGPADLPDTYDPPVGKRQKPRRAQPAAAPAGAGAAAPAAAPAAPAAPARASGSGSAPPSSAAKRK